MIKKTIITENKVELKKKSILTQKEQKKLDKVLSDFKKKIKTIEDVKKNSAVFYIKKTGDIEETNLTLDLFKSSLGEMMFRKKIKDSKEDLNGIKHIIQMYFVKGKQFKTYEEMNKFNEKAEKIMSENEGKLLELEDEVSSMLMVEINSEKEYALNAFEYITSYDKVDKETYVVIADKPIINEVLEYQEDYPNYFKND